MLSIKTIIFILAMLVYAIVYVAKKLQEQAAIKRAKEEQARRKLESLRTGRVEVESLAPTVVSTSGGSTPGPLSHQEATRRLEELAERRRLQLDELRRRAAAQGRTTTPQAIPAAPAHRQTRPAPATAPRPMQRQPAPAARQPAPAPRQPAPTPRRAAARPRPVTPARPAPVHAEKRAAPPRRRTPQEVEEAERRARGEPMKAPGDTGAPKQAPGSTAASRTGMARILIPTGKASASEWRRVMLLRELLAPPISLRPEDRDDLQIL